MVEDHIWICQPADWELIELETRRGVRFRGGGGVVIPIAFVV